MPFRNYANSEKINKNWKKSILDNLFYFPTLSHQETFFVFLDFPSNLVVQPSDSVQEFLLVAESTFPAAFLKIIYSNFLSLKISYLVLFAERFVVNWIRTKTHVVFGVAELKMSNLKNINLKIK